LCVGIYVSQNLSITNTLSSANQPLFCPINYQRETKLVGASSLINDQRFRQVDVDTDSTSDIEMNKRTVTHGQPLHVGYFVYQYAKPLMLQFYYDFFARYIERPLFQRRRDGIALAGVCVDDLPVDRGRPWSTVPYHRPLLRLAQKSTQRNTRAA